MIRTLRITSIIAVVLAATFFVLPAIFGVRGDEQIEEFLNSAGVIEEFNDARGDRVGDNQQEVSPLVKQAEAFALYLNPPPKARPEPSVSRDRPRPRTNVSPKFRLVGTSYYALHPELSLALIDEPGKGLRWVKQSGEVSHLIIEQIKDGIVVVRDGERTFEIVAERPKKRSLIKNGPSVQIGDEKEKYQEESNENRAILSQKEIETAREKALAEVDAMLRELEVTQTDIAPAEANSDPEMEKVTPAARERRHISGRENMRISSEEANKLGHLGRRLKKVKTSPRRIRADETEGDVNFSEPNFGDKNGPIQR